MKVFRFVLLFASLLLFRNVLHAQGVAINTDGSDPDPSAILDVQSTSAGLLIPRLTSAQMNAIPTPTTGLLIFNSTTQSFHFRETGAWVELLSGRVDELSDADGDTKVMVEESADEDVIRMEVQGLAALEVVATLGGESQLIFPSGSNMLIGRETGQNLDDSDGISMRNTLIGRFTGRNLSSSQNNTFLGHAAGEHVINGSGSVVIGDKAAQNSTALSGSIIIGAQAGLNYSDGSSIIIGRNAADNLEIGCCNQIIGNLSARQMTNGSGNLFIGPFSSGNLINGSNNLAIGLSVAPDMVNGNGNILIGNRAGVDETSISNKLFIGNQASGSLGLRQEPLVYGEMRVINPLLRINGIVNIDSLYFLPTDAGTPGQVLTFGLGEDTSWEDIPETSMSSIIDSDDDTKIQVEESTDEDVIRFDIEGEEALVITEDASNSIRFDLPNNFRNVFFGHNAGQFNEGDNNTFVGAQAGAVFEIGGGNTFIGSRAGILISEGQNNTLLGFQSGQSMTIAEDNTAIGRLAGSSVTTGSQNTVIGNESGSAITVGQNNITLGFRAGNGISTGSGNLALGNLSLLSNNGNSNVAVGKGTGANMTSGDSNTLIGIDAGSSKSGGDFNVLIGRQAGQANGSGSNNVFIGYMSGAQVSGSNRLFIENSNSPSPLIYGEFDNDILGFNGDVAIGHQAPTAALHVEDAGTAGQQTIVAVLESNTSDRPTLLFSEFPTSTAANGMSIEYNGSGSVFQDKLVVNGVGAIPRYEFMNTGAFKTLDGDLSISNPGADRHLRIADVDGNEDRVIIRQNSTNDVYFGDCDNNDGKVFFRAAGSNRMVILENGRVGIGTTAPTALLSVNGTACKPGGGSWVACSDRRLKQDIIDFSDGLDELLQIRPVRYHYNERSGIDTAPEYIGVIAQEIEEIAPYMVSTVDLEGEEFLQVDNSAMTYMLINAMQEQQEIIEQLKERINKLESSK